MRRVLAAYDRHRGGRTIVLAWLITRVLVFAVFALAERFVVGDVFYYHRKIAAMFEVGLGRTLNEYPTPVAWMLWLPYGVTGGRRIGYLVAFVIFMMALDAVFTLALWRLVGRRHDWAIDFWIGFVALIGILSYLRFDLLPAVLAGGALLAARRRGWLTGALTGLGTAIKLWPALLIGSFLAYRRDRRPTILGFVVVGFGLAAISLVAAGWSRLVSPLTWQSGRGLQIESIWATPLMIGRAIHQHRWLVDISKFQAYEIFGPGVRLMLLVSTLATLVGFGLIIALYVRGFRNPDPSPVAIGLAVLSTIAITIVTNKTLSPQYLLWLGGPMAALILLRRTASEAERQAIQRLAAQLLGLALLTHLVYPLLYDGLLGRQGYPMIITSTVATTLRNAGLLLFSGELWRLSWRFLGHAAAPAHAAAATVRPARSS